MADSARPEISRSKPGLFIFLIDQSSSMGQPFIGSDHPKADAVALTVNKAIENLILNCMPRGDVEDYYHLCGIGYGGTEARLAFRGELEGFCPVPVSRMAEHPLRHELRDSDTGQIKVPVWIDPVAGGKTPMTGALQLARQITTDWTSDFTESIPPIVLNISDGAASDGNPTRAAKELIATGTEHGNTLLFNLQLTSRPAAQVLYPNTDADLKTDGARLMFGISSWLPDYMVDMARALGVDAKEGARGFVLNGDMVSLTNFLTIGTAPAPKR